MKTIITSSGNNVASKFDRRFGRAEWFCVYDENTKEVQFHKNENVDSNHGAGTRAAEKMVELQAGKIISGDFGPKAKELLEKFNIQMVIIQENDITVERLIQRIK